MSPRVSESSQRIYEGQPVGDGIKHTNPVFVVRRGRFIELTFQEPLSFTGIQIVAMDSRLTRAPTWGCTWDYAFFATMTDDDVEELSDSLNSNERTHRYHGEVARQQSRPCEIPTNHPLLIMWALFGSRPGIYCGVACCDSVDICRRRLR